MLIISHGVIGFRASHIADVKACPELDSFNCRNGKHGMSNKALKGVKPRFPKTCRQAGNNSLQNASHAVAFTGGIGYLIFHEISSLAVKHRKESIVKKTYVTRNIFEVSVSHTMAAFNVGSHSYSLALKSLI